MSDIKYTIIIDDKALIQSFKYHEELADETSIKIAKSYNKAATDIESSANAANSLSKAIDKVNSSLNLSETLLGNFDKLQRIISIAAPIMANYGITLADILRPLEVIGVHSRITANNLIALNEALVNFKLNPTAEGFREIEVSLISLINQFNGFETDLLRIKLAFRDVSTQFVNLISYVKDLNKELFGLAPTFKIISSSSIGYGANILKLSEYNSKISNGFDNLKDKSISFIKSIGLQQSAMIALENIYTKIRSAIDSLINSFESIKQVIKNVVSTFNEIKSKFLDLFSSLESSKEEISKKIKNLLVDAFSIAWKALIYTVFGWISSLPNMIVMILGAPAIVGIGAALANAILGGFIFTWKDILSGKFIPETTGVFYNVLSYLINSARGTLAAFKNVYVDMASSIFSQMAIPIANFLENNFSRILAFKLFKIISGISLAINDEITKIFTLPLKGALKFSDLLNGIYYKSIFIIQDLFLNVKYKWALDLKGISQLLNVLKNDVIGSFSLIKSSISSSLSNIDLSGISSNIKKGFDPIITGVKFFIPRMVQEFGALILSIKSFDDALIVTADIMYRVFTSKPVQDGIKNISSAFEFIKINSSNAISIIKSFGSTILSFIPQSTKDFIDLLKTIKSFDDALIVTADIAYRLFSTYSPMIKQFGNNFVQLSKDIYSKVINSFTQLGSIITANVPNSLKEVIGLIKAMENIDQIGSVAIKSFNILYKAMSESILSTMPMIISYFKKFYDFGMTGFISMYVSLKKYTDMIKSFGISAFNSLSTIISQFTGLISLTPQFINLLQQMFPVISKVYKGVAGIGYGASNWSGIMALAIPLLAQLNGGLGQTIGLSLTLAGIIGGALSYAFSQFIISIGKGISFVSDFFVEIGVKAAESYVKIKSTFDILAAVIEGVSRSTEKTGFNVLDFNSRVAQMSIRWNMSMVDIAKGTQELVLVGSQLGLTADQVHRLTEVVAQYAKINKESVYDSAVAFGSALNGNSQSVLKYGVKLSDANTQHYLFMSGQEKLFAKMSDGEKVQARYNNILKQFSVVSGVADTASKTLADQSNALNSRLELLSAKFGEGSYVIENTNIIAYALNKTLSLVSDKMAYLGGITSSILGRLGQVTGAFLQLSIKIFVTIKAFTLLRILLESKFWADFATKTIPLIGISFQTLVNTLAKSEVKLNSIRGLLSGFAKIGLNEIKSAFINVGIVVGSNVTVMTILSGIMAKISAGFMVLVRFISPFLGVAARMAGWVGLLVTAIMGLYKAFKYLEDQTGVFSTIWEVLADELSRTSEFIESIKNAFVDAFRTIASWAEKAVGIVVYSITGMITPLIYAASLLGKKFISPESYEKLKQLEFRLNGLNGALVASGFSLTEFGKRSLASSGDLNPLIDKTKLLEDIMKLSSDLADAGKDQLRILSETQKQRMDLLNAGLRNEVITQQRYNEIKKLIDLDYFTKRKEEVAKQLQGYDQVMKTISGANYASEKARLLFENEERLRIIREAQAKHLKTNEETNAALLLSDTYLHSELKKLKVEYGSTWSDLGDAIKASFTDVKITVSDLAKDIHDALVNGIASSMQWVGRSLAQHNADWKDLQKGMGNILAGLASQFGNYCIAVGMAMTATGPISGWSGAAAISAGIALNVLAGALGSMGQDAPGTNMAGSKNIQDTLGPDLNQMPGAPDKAQRQEPQNVLNVTINGDVLDSDESSMRIVKLINEAYDKKGVVLRQGAFA